MDPNWKRTKLNSVQKKLENPKIHFLFDTNSMIPNRERVITTEQTTNQNNEYKRRKSNTSLYN